MDRRVFSETLGSLFGLGVVPSDKIASIKSKERKHCEKHSADYSISFSFKTNKGKEKKKKNKNADGTPCFMISNNTNREINMLSPNHVINIEEKDAEAKHDFCLGCIVEKMLEAGINLPAKS